MCAPIYSTIWSAPRNIFIITHRSNICCIILQATNIAWQSGSSLTCSVPRGQGIGLPVIVTTAGYRSGSSAPNFFSYVGGGLPLDPPVLYTSDRTVAVPTSITFRWLQSEPPDRIPPQSFTVCYWTVINDKRIICRVYTPSQLQVRLRCKYNTICPITFRKFNSLCNPGHCFFKFYDLLE